MVAAIPEWLDKGDNAWQLIAATLVAIQSVPGLMTIYAGLMRRRWAVNSAFMALYAFAATLICWVLFAYKFSFGEKLIPILGKPGLAVQHGYLLGQASLPASSFHYKNGTIKTPEEKLMFPMATLVYFQFAFAAVTVVLLAGALLDRMNFNAWMLFVPLWVTLSYTVGAFSLWGGGFLYHWGVIDFAGGFVIHLSSGVSGYTAAYWVDKRLKEDLENMDECFSVPLVGVGAGILWLGWTGFNGGAPYAAGMDASMAVVNTHIAAATSLFIWTVLDAAVDKETSFIHAVQGLITGLVCITPGAGVVEGWAAMVMGLSAGGTSWFTMVKGENVLRWLHLECLEEVDDTLKVLHTHAISGRLLGGILTGLFAEPGLCDLFLPVKGSGGAFYGSGFQLVKQLVGAAFIIVWNVGATCIICCSIRIMVPLRMDDTELKKDLPRGTQSKEQYAGHDEVGKLQKLYGPRTIIRV